jgi:hypothetical protein
VDWSEQPRPDLALLRGAIDMHAHTHPALFPRSLDDSELAKIAIQFGMRGFVLKDHDSLTTGRAYYIKRLYPEIEPFGAIVLNRSVGGINAHVVQAAIHYGAKVIWMPTNHSKWHAEYFKMSDYPGLGRRKRQLPGPGGTIFDQAGELKPEVLTILDLVAEADVCLATGHLNLAEVKALHAEAVNRGVSKFLVTHANWALNKLDLDTQREFLRAGAFIEYVSVSCVSPIFYEQKPAELASWIKELSGDRLVLTSDMGQLSGPPHPEGLRMLLASLLGEGVPYEQLERMVRVNPARLLGLT